MRKPTRQEFIEAVTTFQLLSSARDSKGAAVALGKLQEMFTELTAGSIDVPEGYIHSADRYLCQTCYGTGLINDRGRSISAMSREQSFTCPRCGGVDSNIQAPIVRKYASHEMSSLEDSLYSLLGGWGYAGASYRVAAVMDLFKQALTAEKTSEERIFELILEGKRAETRIKYGDSLNCDEIIFHLDNEKDFTLAIAFDPVKDNSQRSYVYVRRTGMGARKLFDLSVEQYQKAWARFQSLRKKETPKDAP